MKADRRSKPIKMAIPSIIRIRDWARIAAKIIKIVTIVESKIAKKAGLLKIILSIFENAVGFAQRKLIRQDMALGARLDG